MGGRGTLGIVNVHGIGHGETCNGKTPEKARDIIRLHHAKLLAELASKLKAVPEGDGTMPDNTTIIYFSDAGNEHHTNLSEWPYVVIGGSGGRMKLTERYIRYPQYGADGHKTILMASAIDGHNLAGRLDRIVYRLSPPTKQPDPCCLLISQLLLLSC